MQALSQTNAGDTYTIKWMFGVPEILETMRNMDIKEGSTIQVIQKCRITPNRKSHANAYSGGNQHGIDFL